MEDDDSNLNITENIDDHSFKTHIIETEIIERESTK